MSLSSSISSAVATVEDFFTNLQEQDLFFTFKAEGLPDADFAVIDFKVNEALSQPYSIDLALASRTPDHDLSQLTDRPALLSIHDRYQKVPRYFHGVVSGAMRGNKGHRITQYNVTLMPQLHRLRYGSNCRIFQDLDIVEIAMKVLEENGVTHLENLTTGIHKKREYATQYHESHFDFVNRILAEEGVVYYFRHEERPFHQLP